MQNRFPRLLALDTSTLSLSVALLLDGELAAERTLRTPRGHSGLLLGAVDELLTECGTSIHEMDALAVGLGPGSFVGLRIGLALFKGVAVVTDVPVMGVSSLAAMARGVTAEGLVVPTLDARKQEMYCGAYRHDFTSGALTAALSDRAANATLLADLLTRTRTNEEPITLFGAGLAPYGAALCESLRQRGIEPRLLGAAFRTPRAVHIGQLALATPKRVALSALEPNYQRPSEAELA